MIGCNYAFSENLALHKPAYQSGGNFNHGAEKAVDGVIYARYPGVENNRTCAVPYAGPGNRAWWYVDLGVPRTIDKVTIYVQMNDACPSCFGKFIFVFDYPSKRIFVTLIFFITIVCIFKIRCTQYYILNDFVSVHI